MSRLSVIVCVGMLALAVSGCESGSNVNSAASPPASPEVKQEPVVQPFIKPPLISQQPTTTIAAAPPGLIQSTNPSDRAKQVLKGRPDPFALLPGEAAPLVLTTPPQKAVFRLPSLPIVPAKTAPKIVTRAIHPNNSNAGSLFNPSHGNVLPPAPPISTLPPPPQADLARAITVMGVVQVGNETEAIVKVPNEATSRYIQVGQRLSNGQVLVKRIEVNQGSNPVVILEQYGIEVARAVGEESVNPASTGKPTAVPSSPPPPSEFSPGDSSNR